MTLSTSSLIWPSYTIRATIFEKFYRPEKFPKTEYFPTKRIILIGSYTPITQFPPCSGTFHFQAELVNFTSLLESIILNRAIMNSLQEFLLPYLNYSPYCNPSYLRLAIRAVSQVGQNKLPQTNKNYCPAIYVV